MSLETSAHRAAERLRTATDVDVDVDVGLARLRRTHRHRITTRLAGVALAAACVVGGVLVLDGTDRTAPPVDEGPVDGPVSPSVSETPTSPLGTGSWQDYMSPRYDFTVGHPPDWTNEPANRDWTWESDVRDSESPAHEAFLSPDGRVRVSVWNAPLDASTRQESIPYLVQWVEDYCEESGNSPCTGIADRAVELCLESRDCHPGLLVPFENDVQAFFSGGIYTQDAMTVVAVWRGESSRYVAQYGGSQRLLEAFLSTMEVWPKLDAN